MKKEKILICLLVSFCFSFFLQAGDGKNTPFECYSKTIGDFRLGFDKIEADVISVRLEQNGKVLYEKKCPFERGDYHGTILVSCSSMDLPRIDWLYASATRTPGGVTASGFINEVENRFSCEPKYPRG